LTSGFSVVLLAAGDLQAPSLLRRLPAHRLYVSRSILRQGVKGLSLTVRTPSIIELVEAVIEYPQHTAEYHAGE